MLYYLITTNNKSSAYNIQLAYIINGPIRIDITQLNIRFETIYIYNNYPIC